MIRLNCPKCDRPWGVENSLGGQIWTCPSCRSEFAVPTEPAVPRSLRPHSRHRSESAAPMQVAPQSAALSPPREKENAPGPLTAGDPARAPVGHARDETPSYEGLQLAAIASDPVIELDPVEDSQEVEEEAPILAELDRDEEGEPSTELDDALEVIFPPTVEAPRKRIDPPRPGPNRSFLLAGVAVTAVALVGGLAGFLISYSRPVNGATTPETDPSIQLLVQRGATIETDETDPKKPIVAIRLVGPQFSGADLSVLKIAPQLRTLDLSDAHVSNIDLEQIATSSALENLTLSGTKVSDRGMVSLKKLTSLRRLDLSRTIVTDPGLLELRGLGKLKELLLVGSLANGAALKVVLPHLNVRD
jgi:hypothetical protein